MFSIFSISSIFCMLTKLSIVISSGIAGFHNLWSQDFENAQCLEETQVGYTQDRKKVYTHHICHETINNLFDHHFKAQPLKGMQAQKVYVRDLMINCLDRNRYYQLIPCTILNRYCFTCIVHTYKESQNVVCQPL